MKLSKVIKELLKERIDNVPVMGVMGLFLIGFGWGIISLEINQWFFNYYLQDTISLFSRILLALLYLIFGVFIIIKSRKGTKKRK